MNWLNNCWGFIDKYTHENADRLYNIAYWSGGILGVLFSKDLMHERKIALREILKMRIDRQINFLIHKPTIIGWAFIAFVGLSYCFSNEKDTNQKNANLGFQKNSDKSERDRKKSDSLYVAKLEDIDKGLIRRDTVWIKQLDKWGLKIKDSMIVKKDGQPHIALFPGTGAGFKGEYNNNVFSMKGFVTNDGTATAFGIYIRTRMLIIYEDSLYRFKWLSNENTKEHDLVSQRGTGIKDKITLSETLINQASNFIITIEGHYYTDYERSEKNRRKIDLVVGYAAHDSVCYSINESVDSVLKHAKPPDFLYKKL